MHFALPLFSHLVLVMYHLSNQKTYILVKITWKDIFPKFWLLYLTFEPKTLESQPKAQKTRIWA